MAMCCLHCDALPQMGCVPVTMTDHVFQPFEPEVHWDQFSLHVAEEDIPNLHTRLEAVSPEQLQEYQVCVWGGGTRLEAVSPEQLQEYQVWGGEGGS